MAVLTTLDTLSVLFTADQSNPGFLHPQALRKKLETLPEGAGSKQALGIAQQMIDLAVLFGKASDEAMANYLQYVTHPDTSVEAWLETQKPLDALRDIALPELINLRMQLRESLTREEWALVFG